MYDTSRLSLERLSDEDSERALETLAPSRRRAANDLVAFGEGTPGWAAGLYKEEARRRAVLRAARRILQLEAHVAALEARSGRDLVTGVWNRAAVLDLLVSERARSRRARQSFGLVMLDVDGLDALDDASVRDDVLRATARRLSAALRPYDVLSRYGDETFLVLAPGVDGSSLGRLVERMTEELAQAPVVLTDGSSFAVTCSCGGLAASCDWASGQEVLLQMASDAVSVAKERGPGSVELVPARRPPEKARARRG